MHICVNGEGVNETRYDKLSYSIVSVILPSQKQGPPAQMDPIQTQTSCLP